MQRIEFAGGARVTTRVIPIVSLFSGAGGMDLGFRQAGFRPVIAFDNNAAAVRSYNFNAKRNIASCLDLTHLKDDDLPKMLAGAGQPPRGVIGAPPCQGFSVGNASADPDDPRNKLLYRYVRVLKAIDSWHHIDFFVFENVPGLKSLRHAVRFQRIWNRLESAGFYIHETQLDAYDFSVAQHRRRLFLVGLNKRLPVSKEFEFPSGTSKRVTVRDAISHLPEPVFRVNGMTRRDIPYHPNHWTMEPRSKRFAQQSFNLGRSFRKLEWDEPSRTVAYGNREIHIHPEGHRRLSILEALLLQGFPQTYVLCGTFCNQVDQISNAVPPPVAYEIAKTLHLKLYDLRRKATS